MIKKFLQLIQSKTPQKTCLDQIRRRPKSGVTDQISSRQIDTAAVRNTDTNSAIVPLTNWRILCFNWNTLLSFNQRSNSLKVNYRGASKHQKHVDPYAKTHTVTQIYGPTIKAAGNLSPNLYSREFPGDFNKF